MDHCYLKLVKHSKQLEVLEIGGEQITVDFLKAIAKKPHQLRSLKFEEGHGLEDDLHEIFKDTNLLVYPCSNIYYKVANNRYINVFCSEFDDLEDHDFNDDYFDIDGVDSDDESDDDPYSYEHGDFDIEYDDNVDIDNDESFDGFD